MAPTDFDRAIYISQSSLQAATIHAPLRYHEFFSPRPREAFGLPLWEQGECSEDFRPNNGNRQVCSVCADITAGEDQLT